jgi:drug/metabolite transporter (DMT)-like permease
MFPVAQSAYTSRQITGVTLALLAAIAFSAKSILVKLAYAERVDAVTLLALRMAFSVPFFVVAAWWVRAGQDDVELTGKDKLMVVWLGLVGYYLASLLDFLGLQYINVGLARLILFLYPTMVTLIAAWWLRQRISPAAILALIVSYAGIALVFLHDVQTLQRDVVLGSALVFGSALAYAIFLVGSPALIHKMGATRFTAYVMLVSCMASVLQFVLTHPLADLHLPMRVYEDRKSVV